MVSNLTQEQICNEISSLIIAELDLADHIKSKKLLSYSSIEFFEVSILRVKCGKNKNWVSLKKSFQPLLLSFSFIIIEQVKSEDPWIRILINSLEEIRQLHPLFLKLCEEAYSLVNNEIFSCCSRYVQCSDEKECIQPNKLLATGCAYGKHLKNGRIFYGKNCNVQR